jgi:hypothetical protein
MPQQASVNCTPRVRWNRQPPGDAPQAGWVCITVLAEPMCGRTVSLRREEAIRLDLPFNLGSGIPTLKSAPVSTNPAYHPGLSRYPVIVVIRSSCLAAFALLVPAANAQQIPVLTVCEALHELPKYNGKVVIVVGRTFLTFEGSFMNEKCEPDGTTMVQGKKWLSMPTT